MDDCVRRVQALQAESTQLRDENLGLSSRSRDLAQRALEDSRRIERLEEANRHLERSVIAYQDERDELAEAFNELRLLVQSEGRGPTASILPSSGRAEGSRLDLFARAHPECRYNPEQGVWCVPTSLLFPAESSAPKASGELLLKTLARILGEDGKVIRAEKIVAEVIENPIQLASTHPSSLNPDSLARERASRVRSILANLLDVEADSLALELEVVPHELAPGAENAPEAPAQIRIHFQPSTDGSP